MSKFLCPIDGHRPTSSSTRSCAMRMNSSSLTVGCDKEHCLSNRDGCCNFVAVTSIEGSDTACADYFNVSTRDVSSSVNAIRAAFVLNAFCEFLLNKTTLDVTTGDVTTLKSSRVPYATWSSTKSIALTFDEVMRTLDVLVTRL